METIQNILEKNKGDTELYKIIFNILTDNNNIKNYTNNSNGIFFNMNKFDYEQIEYLCENVNIYSENKKENEKIEINRENIIKEFTKTIDTTYKTELKEIIDTNKKQKNNLSTYIENEHEIENKNNEENILKKKKNQRIKKSIRNYQKPVIYKGVYENIKNILSKTSKRTRNSSVIEEDDELYEEENDIIEESVYNSESETEECKGGYIINADDSDQEVEETTLNKELEMNDDLFGYESE